ncbi:MAG: dihydroorotate dehydrogenase electron transfer subunit [Melioribacteraceae bacterium]|nr:MAG: dihydroorotate dehydrogenase electron transfer subunit [Melioribacteraceae bacterium]
MVNEKIVIQSVEKLQPSIYLLKAFAPIIASQIKPSQFCNIKVSENEFPLLRRPFSVCDVDGDSIHFMFDVHGEGTRILSEKIKGDKLEVLGPLGNGFNYNKNFKRAIFVAGGLGVAPFPYLTKVLQEKIEIITLIGARNSDFIIEHGLININIATDDGSVGFHGNVVELLNSHKEKFINEETVVFACGPTPMLKSLQQFSIENNVECQISTECAMACGFGICQGCPVHSADEDKNLLVCKDGPVFDAKDIKL